MADWIQETAAWSQNAFSSSTVLALHNPLREFPDTSLVYFLLLSWTTRNEDYRKVANVSPHLIFLVPLSSSTLQGVSVLTTKMILCWIMRDMQEQPQSSSKSP